MKIAENVRYGEASVIAIVDRPIPKIKSNEILVNVHYSSVNRTDMGFLWGKPAATRLFTGLLKPSYPALGCEFAGQVTQIGDTVSRFKVGDRVFGFDDARRGFGGHAEYKAIKESRMVTQMPKGVSFKDAAVSTEGAHYAQGFINKVTLGPGSHVFVHGATGGIGSAMVQLLVARGVTVTASSTTEHVPVVSKLGAIEVIDWQTDPLESHQGTYDHFFDAVGKSSFKVARPMIKPGGAYVSSELGKRGENVWLSIINPIQRLFTKRNILFPVPSTNKKLLDEIALRLGTKEFKPLIDRTYAFSDIRLAYEYVETGQKLGNVVIQIQK